MCMCGGSDYGGGEEVMVCGFGGWILTGTDLMNAFTICVLEESFLWWWGLKYTSIPTPNFYNRYIYHKRKSVSLSKLHLKYHMHTSLLLYVTLNNLPLKLLVNTPPNKPPG